MLDCRINERKMCSTDHCNKRLWCVCIELLLILRQSINQSTCIYLHSVTFSRRLAGIDPFNDRDYQWNLWFMHHIYSYVRRLNHVVLRIDVNVFGRWRCKLLCKVIFFFTFNDSKMFNLLIIYSHILNDKNEIFCVLKMNTDS